MIFLITWWKEILFAALIAALSFQTHRLSNAEQEIVAVNTRFQLAIDAAKLETKKAELISKRTNDELNSKLPIRVAEAKRNALANYQNRFRRTVTSGSGTTGSVATGGFHTGNASGMHDSGSDTAFAVPPSSSESPAKESAGLSSCDPRFISDAAEASVILNGWMEWARANQLPMEK